MRSNWLYQCIWTILMVCGLSLNKEKKFTVRVPEDKTSCFDEFLTEVGDHKLGYHIPASRELLERILSSDVALFQVLIKNQHGARVFSKIGRAHV